MIEACDGTDLTSVSAHRTSQPRVRQASHARKGSARRLNSLFSLISHPPSVDLYARHRAGNAANELLDFVAITRFDSTPSTLLPRMKSVYRNLATVLEVVLARGQSGSLKLLPPPGISEVPINLIGLNRGRFGYGDWMVEALAVGV